MNRGSACLMPTCLYGGRSTTCGAFLTTRPLLWSSLMDCGTDASSLDSLRSHLSSSVRSEGRDLVDRWARLYYHEAVVDEISPRQWFWDQVTLFLAWCECSFRIATIPISEFADAGLNSRAAIWSANVSDKDTYFLRFQAECIRLCVAGNH